MNFKIIIYEQFSNMIVRNGHAVISMLQFAKKTKAYKRIAI